MPRTKQASEGGKDEHSADWDLGPVLRADGTPMTDEEAEREFSLSLYTPITGEDYEEKQRAFQQTTLWALRDATRAGQLTPEEWASAWGQFRGCPALLCELNPDFEMRGETTLGDLCEAVLAEIEAGKHPKTPALKEAWANFRVDESAPQGGFWRLFYEWDVILGASKKYHVSTIEAAEFYQLKFGTDQQKAEGYKLRDFIAWLNERAPFVRARAIAKAPKNLSQPTFIEARSVATAISDGRDLRDWRAIEGVIAMLHAPQGAELQTRFEPCPMLLGWWGKPGGAELETLQGELQKLDFDALVTFFVCLSWAIEDYQVTTSLDLIIAAIGRDVDARRTKAARAQWRGKVWRWLLLFDSLAVIGARPGFWKEPRTGDAKGTKRERIAQSRLYSKDALLKIMGQRADDQGALDNSTPPKEVTLATGPWANQFRDNREMLSEFGNVRAVASIPRGKPSGAWAACIGFMLQQRWREMAHRTPVKRVTRSEKKLVTQQFRPFTRRALLVDTWRCDHDVKAILSGDNPTRAKEYWEQAIGLLKKAGVIGHYKELEPLANKSRQDWQKEWLDQPLDIRPTGQMQGDAIKIRKSAVEARHRGLAKRGKKSSEVAT